eukprot:CAMPEP_0171273400 /NCGR_PEP_ID=MMETSP0790-20130122/62267_1 /TAXON_ID=2925 /ORGANISM="Alexandrium catenella, Strain OF101" /LENGTH=34 /DNA_ID= /DNA_START= /DNA_END= /DNA_ORIENTATION=
MTMAAECSQVLASLDGPETGARASGGNQRQGRVV